MTEVPQLLPCYVTPGGLAIVEGRLVRCALGAPGDPASLFHEGPHAAVPWRDDACAEAALGTLRAGLSSPM
ncbi:MAG: hypothetical protein MI741_22330, partial [Rhodospirillales bacterium]|nr:hypothetical protein [Rhodospirillales bacterium]